MNKLGIIFVLTTIFLTGCTFDDTTDEKDYDGTKKMVLDIIQTDEGKKAVREILQEDEMKKLLVIDAQETKQAVEDTLASDKSVDMWKKLFDDPTFVEVFYGSVKDEHKKFIENLLADPTIQRKLMEIMEDPEMEKQFEKILKSAAFKEHLKKLIEETYETPTFKKRAYDLMKKIVDEKDKDKENDKKNKSKEEGTPDEGEM